MLNKKVTLHEKYSSHTSVSVRPLSGQPSLVCVAFLWLPFVYRPVSRALSRPPLPGRVEATEERKPEPQILMP